MAMPLSRTSASIGEVVPEAFRSNIIKTVGLGLSGQSSIEYLIERGVPGVEFICIGCDARALSRSRAHKIIQLGPMGNGIETLSQMARNAAERAAGDIRAALNGTHMLFITTSIDSDCGIGAASVVARIAMEMGILTVAMVSGPLEGASGRRTLDSESGPRRVDELRANVDSLIVLRNARLHNPTVHGFHPNSAYAYANDLLRTAVGGFDQIINVQNQVNIDFEDVRIVMCQQWTAFMGTALGRGPDRARIAAEQALACPLMEGVDLSSARGVLVLVASASGQLKLFESKLALNSIRACASPYAHVVYGVIYDDALVDQMRVTLVATGIHRND